MMMISLGTVLTDEEVAYGQCPPGYFFPPRDSSMPEVKLDEYGFPVRLSLEDFNAQACTSPEGVVATPAERAASRSKRVQETAAAGAKKDARGLSLLVGFYWPYLAAAAGVVLLLVMKRK